MPDQFTVDGLDAADAILAMLGPSVRTLRSGLTPTSFVSAASASSGPSAALLAGSGTASDDAAVAQAAAQSAEAAPAQSAEGAPVTTSPRRADAETAARERDPPADPAVEHPPPYPIAVPPGMDAEEWERQMQRLRRASDTSDKEGETWGDALKFAMWSGVRATLARSAAAPRILRRDSFYHQSSGHVNIRYVAHPDDSFSWGAKNRLVLKDWFDRLLALNTLLILFLMCTLYTVMLFVWTGIYMGIGAHCGGVDLDFQAAFAFSLETATTVGYVSRRAPLPERAPR